MTTGVDSEKICNNVGEPEVRSFGVNVAKVLDMLVNRLYAEEEVFLRELISNASDAICKASIAGKYGTDPSGAKEKSYIRIVPDHEEGTLTVIDNGIGMSKEDLITNLGTIAKSDTEALLLAISEGDVDKNNLIGRFGVGFYSVYMVAKKVEVMSKREGEEYPQCKWVSSVGDTYQVSQCGPRDEQLERGTSVKIYLRDEKKDYLKESRLKEVINRHSQYLSYPIQILVEREVKEEKKEEEVTEVVEEEGDESKKPLVEEIKGEEEGEKEKKGEKKMVKQFERVNKFPPIWERKPKDITESEYTEFYKHISNDWEGPMCHKHFSTEGQLEFKGVLFIPNRAPFDLFEQNKKKKSGIKLYVRNIFVNEDCEYLVPDYLNLVKGAVNSYDLPLNVSRESIQQHDKILKVMKNTLIKKCIEMFDELVEKGVDVYNAFYSKFSKNIKLGVHEDTANREKIASFLRYRSTICDTESVSLDDYIARMSEHQKNIYYLVGESEKAVKSSVFLEVFRKKNFEVLLMVDPIDEYSIQSLPVYKGKSLVLITKDGIELEQSDEEKEKKEEDDKEFSIVCEVFKEVIGDAVEKVVVSDRMVDSPCCLLTSKFGWSANMERIAKAQALRDTSVSSYMVGKKIMEINPDHRIIIDFKKRLDDDRNNVASRNVMRFMYETSLVSSGFSLDDPNSYAKRIFQIFASMGVGDELFSRVDPSEEAVPGLTSSDMSEKAAEMEEVE